MKLYWAVTYNRHTRPYVNVFMSHLLLTYIIVRSSLSHIFRWELKMSSRKLLCQFYWINTSVLVIFGGMLNFTLLLNIYVCHTHILNYINIAYLVLSVYSETMDVVIGHIYATEYYTTNVNKCNTYLKIYILFYIYNLTTW